MTLLESGAILRYTEPPALGTQATAFATPDRIDRNLDRGRSAFGG